MNNDEFTLKERASIFLEEMHISGDEMIQMNHNIDDISKDKIGAYYVADLMAAFIEKEASERQQSPETSEQLDSKALYIADAVRSLNLKESQIVDIRELCIHKKTPVLDSNGNAIGSYCDECDIFYNNNAVGIKC